MAVDSQPDTGDEGEGRVPAELSVDRAGLPVIGRDSRRVCNCRGVSGEGLSVAG